MPRPGCDATELEGRDACGAYAHYVVVIGGRTPAYCCKRHVTVAIDQAMIASAAPGLDCGMAIIWSAFDYLRALPAQETA